MDEKDSTPDPREDLPQVIEGEIVRTKSEEAYRLRCQGKSHSEIADILGYEDAEEAANAITKKMKADAQYLSSEGRENIARMEMDVLYQLRNVHWLAAMSGDLKSGEMLIKIHEKIVRLAQLDAIDTGNQSHAVLVIGGDQQNYVAKLKELAEG